MSVIRIILISIDNNIFIKLGLKFITVYIVLDAVKAPLHLADGRHYGDGAKLADLTGLQEVIWVMIWLGFGILGLVYLWRGHV